MSESPNVQYARRVIRGEITPDAKTALSYSANLKGENRFDLASRVLIATSVTAADPLFVKVRQQVANCTYKDEDIPMPHRFFQALEILRSDCALDTTRDTATLGLGGAIYKRLWEYGGQREHLEKALAYYHTAYAEKPKDDGYAAINTAFILDLLGWQESTTIDGIPPEVPRQRHEQAEQIRTTMIAELLAQGGPAYEPKWWYYASLAEAALGLERYDEAVAWLQEGRNDLPKRWEFDSTARQMAMLVRVQSSRRGNDGRAAYKALQDGLGVNEHAVRSVVLGKVGLALSGGGFRASLYHIGVLAKLAELDVLRHIEVISCVSGGSILGAYYYLELQKKLEEKPSLTQQDYIEIVQNTEARFLDGVQTNIRTRVASNPLKGLKMAFVPGYSRSSRVGELYEDKLYKRVDGKKRRVMTDLLIKPAGTTGAFNPKYDNWTRDSKVPILVLNATTINNGHNWQFTAKWMGESPQAISGAIDSVPRLRRMEYTAADAPPQVREIPLGVGVGASACVPGLFEPIEFRKLYEDRTVRLVDGGVHDNQGLSSLLEQACKVILVSDASGQMSEEKIPAGGVLPVVLRTNSILQSRIREAQHDQLQSLHRSGAIDGMMFIHLTQDLEADPISWEGADDRDENHKQRPVLTSYGVDRRVQKQLAEVRTDLDSFTDAEAFGLMTSGYLMAEKALLVDKCAPTLPIQHQPAYWRFLGAREALTNVGSPDNVRMHALLKASKDLAGKIWVQSKVLSGVASAAAFLAVLSYVIRLWDHRNQPPGVLTKLAKWFSGNLPTVGTIVIAITVAVAILAIRAAVKKALHYEKRFDEVLIGLALATVGAVASWIHLILFDQLFLWYGQWKPADPQQPQAQPKAFAEPGSPRLSIKTAPVAQPAPQPKAWTPIVRRLLNFFPPPQPRQ